MAKLRIHAELEQKLAAWREGKPVRAPRLGHTQRETVIAHGPNRGQHSLDLERRAPQPRQELALAWCFLIIEHCLQEGLDQRIFAPRENEDQFVYSDFANVCHELRETRMSDEEKLTSSELAGAESLAWKCLLVGWDRAIAGHNESHYVETSRPQQEQPA